MPTARIKYRKVADEIVVGASHIKKYNIEELKQAYNLINYLFDRASSMSFSPTKYYIRKYSGTVEGSSVFSTIVFALHYSGYLAGSLAMYKIVLYGSVYCTECSKYMQKKRMFLFDLEAENNLNDLFYYLNNKNVESLEALIRNNPYDKKTNYKRIAKGTLFYCENLKRGQLRLEYYDL
ncbi:MAG: hypothetical protein AB1Z23_06920 [Eubacteriales bacterium]